MPIERLAWRAVTAWAALNAQLGRALDVLVGSDRVAMQAVSATTTLALTWPRTLVESTTTAGAVALTLPDAAAHVGFQVWVVLVTGANALTVNGTSVTTRASWVSTGTAWRQVS